MLGGHCICLLVFSMVLAVGNEAQIQVTQLCHLIVTTMSEKGGHCILIFSMVLVVNVQRSSKSCYSTVSFDSDNEDRKKNDVEEDFDNFLGEKAEELQPQGVDPRRGPDFRGVYKVINFNFQLNNIYNVLLWKLTDSMSFYLLF